MAENGSGSRIIAVLEGAWADIRAAHPDVPGVVMITGTARTHRAHEAKLGHFGADRWNTPDGKLPELFVAGELLAACGKVSGGRRVLETLLHEAAHGMAHTRGIQDCSRQNRYHNKKFVQLATELGLTPPSTPHGTIGFSDTTLTDEAAAAWAKTIAAVDAADLPHLTDFIGAGSAGLPAGGEDGDGEDEGTGKKPPRSGVRASVVCACNPPRKLSLSLKQLEIGGVLCALCMGEFEREDGDGESGEED